METIDVIDIGNTVVCDVCNRDYSDSDEQGGLMFSGSAFCPKCTPRIRELAEQYGETAYIEGECPSGVSFRDWVLSLRKGNNTITVQTWA